MTNEQTIKEFLTKMAKQHNRCTAAPYFYVITTKTIFPVGRDNCDDPDHSYQTEEYDTYKLYDDEFTEVDLSEYKELDKDDRQVVYYKYTWEEQGMFLTEDDAKDHLKRNHYHYSEDAHTYVKHAWRAPELEGFFKALFKHFDVDKGNLDLRMEE